jgi:hypothetical protein
LWHSGFRAKHYTLAVVLPASGDNDAAGQVIGHGAHLPWQRVEQRLISQMANAIAPS